MGSERSIGTRLFIRCCHGASFGFGFVLTVLTVVTMFWIAWCYFGLTVMQLSDTQRRAIVNYSYTSSKPSPTPTVSPVRSTTLATVETSINSISKLPTTATVLRGSSRGELPVKVEKGKEPEITSSNAKGDFAARDRSTHTVPGAETREVSTSAVSLPRGPLRPRDEISDSGHKADILSGSSSEESEDDRIHTRRVLPLSPENRAEDKNEPDNRPIRRNPSESQSESRLDISPTKVYDIEVNTGSSRRPLEPEVGRIGDQGKTVPREYVDRDAVVPSRRDDNPRSGADSVYRDLEDGREYPRRSSVDREKSRYDDLDEDRGSRSRYDKRDRGRDSDDRYSKGDTRVYPEDRPTGEDRYRGRERDPEDSRRRGDDDRYDDRYDRDERPRSRDRVNIRPIDKIPDERSPLKDDRYIDNDRNTRIRDEDKYIPRVNERDRIRGDDKYRDDDRITRIRDEDTYKPRDDDRDRTREDGKYKDDGRYRTQSEDRYRDRDDDRYLSRDDDSYRARDDDRYRSRDDDRYRSRDDDRYTSRDDDGYKSRDGDRYRSRDDEERYRTRDEDRYTRDGDRYIDTSRTSGEKDRYRSRTDEDRYAEKPPPRLRDEDIRETISRSSIELPTGDRKSSGSRNYESVRDYDVGVRDRPKDVNPSRLLRPPLDDERYINDDRPSRYDDDDRRISPTRTRNEFSSPRSSLADSRPREIIDDTRRRDNERENRRKDDKYPDKDDRIRSTGIQASRGPVSSGNSRRVVDEIDEYRTRLPNERKETNENSREEVVLDHRSYSSEEEERRENPRSDYESRSRRPSDEPRRIYRDDDRYTRRDPVGDEEYEGGRIRGSYDSDRTRTRDRYDDKYEKSYPARDDRLPPIPLRKYDSYPDEEERARRRDSELSTTRKEDSGGRLRSDLPSRSEDRYYDRDGYSDSRPSSRRRYDDDELDYTDDRRYPPRQPSRSKEPILGSSMAVYPREPSEVVLREKRFQSTENKQQSSRVTVDDIGRDRSYQDTASESRSRDVVRPLSAKDVIEAAMRHSDTSEQTSRKVFYPVFDPRVSNLTSPETIRPSERRGTTITAKKRRSA